MDAADNCLVWEGVSGGKGMHMTRRDDATVRRRASIFTLLKYTLRSYDAYLCGLRLLTDRHGTSGGDDWGPKDETRRDFGVQGPTLLREKVRCMCVSGLWFVAVDTPRL